MWLAPETALSLAVILPVLSTAGIAASSRYPDIRESVSLVAGILLFALVAGLYLEAGQGQEIRVHWVSPLPGLAIAFRVEELGLLFSLVAGFLWPVTTLYSIGYMREHREPRQTGFYFFFALAISCAMGVAFADNLFTLFVFYEFLTLCTWPLVAHSGTEAARRGARTYLGLLLGTSFVFFLLAIVGTWVVAGTLDFREGGVFPDDVSPAVSGVLLVLFILGIGKAAIMPFYGWLPAAMVAPTPVSALLHAVAVVKVGAFTVIKVGVFVFGADLLVVLPSTDMLLYLAAATIVFSSVIAMRQDNLKKRLAYSTISQLNYITVGTLLATSAAVTGGAMHIAMHAFGKITLFFCAGAILVRTGQSEISNMRGLGRRMPVTMTAFFIGSLSIIGAPPGGGSWSKWYLMSGALEAGQGIVMAALMLSTVLNVAYLLPIPVRAFFSDGKDLQPCMDEAPAASLAALVITALACVVLFFLPQSLYELASNVLPERG